MNRNTIERQLDRLDRSEAVAGWLALVLSGLGFAVLMAVAVTEATEAWAVIPSAVLVVGALVAMVHWLVIRWEESRLAKRLEEGC